MIKCIYKKINIFKYIIASDKTEEKRINVKILFYKQSNQLIPVKNED